MKSSQSVSRHPNNEENFFGPKKMAPGIWQFNVWAPKPKDLTLLLKRANEVIQFPMEKSADGFFSVTVGDGIGINHGDHYCFRIDGQNSRPDVAARCYVDDVHGWCSVVDQDQYSWNDESWQGVAKDDLVIYELHIGAFTQAGTWLGAIERLPELVALGVTAVEILPIAQTPGRWNWGYDGVGLFAAENAYGTPDELKQFVDACHQHGLAVILDVVYNHLGPEGNYLSEFGPYFTPKHHTPWGSAWNFDDVDNQHVRNMMLQNAAMWVEDYHFDGLRLDAVHFMFDDSPTPLSIDVGHRFDRLRDSTGRHLHLIGETNVHNASLVKSTSPHGTGFDAVWSDCLMHSLLGIAQPGLDLCHRDHNGAIDAGRALHQGFLYENYPYQRHDAGERADLHSFVVGLQNHDTVGNHPQGRRLKQLASREFQAAAAALYMLYPAIPMLFMGEEFACENPFLFFVEFGDSRVCESVEKGRASEFPEMLKMVGVSPLDPAAFTRSKIGSREDGDTQMWQWYQSLIALRKRFRSSGLLQGDRLVVDADPETGLFRLEYQSDDETLNVLVRLGEPQVEADPVKTSTVGEVLLSTRENSVPFEGSLSPNEAVVLLRKG